MPVVYTHINPKTRKIFYVGIGGDVKRAFRNEGRNSHWARVFSKYGKIVDIISSDISLNSAKEMERFLIATIGVENLTNKTLGGEGAFGLKHSEETKRDISEKLKGRKISDEAKRKMSERLKGHPNYLHAHTDEAKAKISLAFKGKKRSAYFCERVRLSKNGYKPSVKAIDASTKWRKENACLIIELTTGFIGKIWEIEQRFNVCRKAVYYNYKRDLCILNGAGKGLNFSKYKNTP
jgi:hypothetical protein